MVYVYAVTEPRFHPPSGIGLDGAALRVVWTSDLAAVVSDRDDAQVQVTEETLWTHERVVEGLVDGGAVLPARFGSLLRDDEAVEAMLAARRAELASSLQRVRGAVELGVRMAWDRQVAHDEAAPVADRVPVSHGPGAAYLGALSRSRRRARELAERLDRSVAGLFRAQVRRLLTSPRLPVSGAYLVDRQAVEAFRARIAALDAELDEAGIACTGPWPPYSFTGAQRS
jgi:hypothetical protein